MLNSQNREKAKNQSKIQCQQVKEKKMIFLEHGIMLKLKSGIKMLKIRHLGIIYNLSTIRYIGFIFELRTQKLVLKLS